MSEETGASTTCTDEVSTQGPVQVSGNLNGSFTVRINNEIRTIKTMKTVRTLTTIRTIQVPLVESFLRLDCPH